MQKRLVYNLGSEAGFFSEYNNMILAILYCLKHNINFVLYHTNLMVRVEQIGGVPYNLHTIKKLLDEKFSYIKNNIGRDKILRESDTFNEYYIKLKERIINKEISDEKIKTEKQFIEDNLILFRSDYFANKLKISENVEQTTFQKINNFIETGILINE